MAKRHRERRRFGKATLPLGILLFSNAGFIPARAADTPQELAALMARRAALAPRVLAADRVRGQELARRGLGFALISLQNDRKTILQALGRARGTQREARHEIVRARSVAARWGGRWYEVAVQRAEEARVRDLRPSVAELRARLLAVTDAEVLARTITARASRSALNVGIDGSATLADAPSLAGLDRWTGQASVGARMRGDVYVRGVVGDVNARTVAMSWLALPSCRDCTSWQPLRLAHTPLTWVTLDARHGSGHVRLARLTLAVDPGRALLTVHGGGRGAASFDLRVAMSGAALSATPRAWTRQRDELAQLVAAGHNLYGRLRQVYAVELSAYQRQAAAVAALNYQAQHAWTLRVKAYTAYTWALATYNRRRTAYDAYIGRKNAAESRYTRWLAARAAWDHYAQDLHTYNQAVAAMRASATPPARATIPVASATPGTATTPAASPATTVVTPTGTVVPTGTAPPPAATRTPAAIRATAPAATATSASPAATAAPPSATSAPLATLATTAAPTLATAPTLTAPTLVATTPVPPTMTLAPVAASTNTPTSPPAAAPTSQAAAPLSGDAATPVATAAPNGAAATLAPTAVAPTAVAPTAVAPTAVAPAPASVVPAATVSTGDAPTVAAPAPATPVVPTEAAVGGGGPQAIMLSLDTAASRPAQATLPPKPVMPAWPGARPAPFTEGAPGAPGLPPAPVALPGAEPVGLALPPAPAAVPAWEGPADFPTLRGAAPAGGLPGRLGQAVTAELLGTPNALGHADVTRDQALADGALDGAGSYIDPIHGVITTYFGGSTVFQSFHPAVDIAAPLYTPIHAAAAGRVVWAALAVPGDIHGSYGNCVIIQHNGQFSTLYAHMDDGQFPLQVRAGDQVQQGQIIGYEGLTGWTTGPHLHFELRDGGEQINPLLLIPDPQQ